MCVLRKKEISAGGRRLNLRKVGCLDRQECFVVCFPGDSSYRKSGRLACIAANIKMGQDAFAKAFGRYASSVTALFG
jgi:hypothetical protein